MTCWIVEVEHASDTDRDGSWTEIDRHPTERRAEADARYLRGEHAYRGRRVVVRKSDEDVVPLPAPNRAPRGWARRIARARRLIRA